jgi:hypothetical protein
LQGRLDKVRMQVESEDGVVVAEEVLRREQVERELEKERTLCTTFAKQVTELQGKLETAKQDVAAARRERDEVKLELVELKRNSLPAPFTARMIREEGWQLLPPATKEEAPQLRELHGAGGEVWQLIRDRTWHNGDGFWVCQHGSGAIELQFDGADAHAVVPAEHVATVFKLAPCPRCRELEDYKTRMHLASVECSVYDGIPEIDNVRRILRGG